MNEYIKPLVLTDTSDGVKYELDFNRESIKFAEARGFDVSDVKRYPTTLIPKLWYYAFRKNHKNLAENQAERLFSKLFPKGLPISCLTRLLELYQQAAVTNVIDIEDEEDEKNGCVVVEM